MYIGNKIRRLKTYKNPARIFVRVSYFKNPIFWSDILWFTQWSGFWSRSVLKPWNIGLVRISVRITKNIINIRTGFNIVKNWSNSLMFRKTGPIRNTVVIFEFSFLKPSWDDSGRSLGVKADDPWKDESRRSRRKRTISGSKQTILVKALPVMSPWP